jgi:hypothetical protein
VGEVRRSKAVSGNRRKMNRGKLDTHQRLFNFGRPRVFFSDIAMGVELGAESVD